MKTLTMPGEQSDGAAMAMPANEPCVRRLPERPAALDQADLQELDELIDTVWLKGYMPSPEADRIVARASRAGAEFASRLAIRALRLEQALIAAQGRIIRLEWTLAQAAKPHRVGQLLAER